MTNKFLKKEIREIKRRTNYNLHGENLQFIAKKIKSPLLKELKDIQKGHIKQGSLSGYQWTRRYKVGQQLMEELKKKSPQDYDAVYGSL